MLPNNVPKSKNELGHIFCRHLLPSCTDPEAISNLFAYIAMLDKNRFYQHGVKDFDYGSDMVLLDRCHQLLG